MKTRRAFGSAFFFLRNTERKLKASETGIRKCAVCGMRLVPCGCLIIKR